jgi:hypothetical protein
VAHAGLFPRIGRLKGHQRFGTAQNERKSAVDHDAEKLKRVLREGVRL